MINIADLNWPKINVKSFRGFLCLGIAGFLLGLCHPLYGQGTLAETTTAVGLQEELNGGGAQPDTPKPAAKPKPAARPKDSNEPSRSAPKPAPEANNAAERPTRGPMAGETPTSPSLPTRQQRAARGLSEDTNVPDINDFNSFQKELNRINVESKNEEGLWLGRLDRKADLARAIDELVVAQLRFIRKLSVAEHADQTTKAIDLVLKQRQEQLDKLVTKLQEELKEERQQSTERRDKKTTRTGEGLQDQPARERTTPRRTRATTPE